jgi:ketosteroid isomerase-like protein
MTRAFQILLALWIAGEVLAQSPDRAAANKALALDLFDAIERADVAKLDALYAPDFEIWTAGELPISGTRTRAQALEGMRMIAELFPGGLDFTIVAMTAEGDRVAIEAESEGVHVSGKPYHNRYHFLIVVRDGKIVRFKEYMDTLHAAEVLLAPPLAPTSP